MDDMQAVEVGADPVPSERDAFERAFPLPQHCIRVGDNYAPTEYGAWQAANYKHIRDGWLAALKWISDAVPPPAVPEGPDLREFAKWILSESLDAIDLCGGDIQDKAVACGLLIETEVFEPCGEGCVCLEVDDFPLYCYRTHPSLSSDKIKA